MSNTTKRAVLTRKQATDLLGIMKEVAVTAGAYAVATPNTEDKRKRLDAYKEQVDLFEDYLRALSEDAPPPIKPPQAAP